MKLRKVVSADAGPLVPDIAPIACIYCGKPAHLIQLTPHPQMGPTTERRTFECESCDKLTEIAVAR
jgi:hypothetical protein